MMAKLIEPAMESSIIKAIQVTDMSASINSHAPAAGQIDPVPSAPALTPPPDAANANSSSPRTLASLDKQLGPLLFGQLAISRVELSTMGAKIAGQDISAANANMKKPYQDFLDSLSFEPAKLLAREMSADPADSGKVATFLFELACLRSEDAPSLLVADKSLTPGSPMDRFGKLVDSAQKIDIHQANAPLPPWVKTGVTGTTGAGLQIYGIYSGMRGVMDAIKAGKAGEAAISGGGVASEFGSLIIERGLTKGGAAMIKSGGTVFNGFAATSVGKTLGRGAGLFASAITLPFDIHGAVVAFNSAASTKGKEAQDHYVNGGFNVAGAALSLALGAAALAGFGSIAGPVGLIAAVVLVLGAEIYRAARVVDDIDDYIELGHYERLRSGWLAFWNKELDQDVLDRFKIAKTFSDHTQQLAQSAKDLLEGAYEKHLEYIVNGSFEVKLQTVKIWQYQWDENAGKQPYKLDNEPVLIGTDDIVDARNGLPPDLKGLVKGSPGENKGVFWRLGDGNDQVYGVKDRPNSFSFRDGAKALTGGDKDDGFYFETTEAQLNRQVQPARTSVLDGAEGSDTLSFVGSRPVADTRHVGYDINLQTGKVALRNQDPAKDDILVAQIKSVENISTLRHGSNRVTGSDKADQISANGNDHINAGPGDDTIAIRGTDGRVDGGPGVDRYYLAETSARTTIIEDGEEASLIVFGWPLENIQRWQIIDTTLVISSLRGKDGELPEHVLTIENIYKHADGKRLVQNRQLQFRTRDGYELVPLLPDHLTDSLAHDVECRVTVLGKRPPAPYIVNNGTVVFGERKPMHNFVSRAGRRVDFISDSKTSGTSGTLFLDYKYEEILNIKVSYQVEASEGVSGYTFLSYSNFNLWIFLPSKIITFVNVIRERQQQKTADHVYASIKAAGIHCAHDIVLVMQDGQSYQLITPSLPYHEDAADPGYKSRAAEACLRPRHGQYSFIRPQRLKPYLLAATPQKVDFPAAPHAGIYVLQGQASSYDVYPVSNTTFSLSTPGAVAQTSNASTWTIFSAKLTETATRNDIRLNSDTLQIGSAIVQLPSLDHPGPVESISVETSSGNIYAVELLFEALQLYVINAHGYASVDALLADLQAHSERNELAVKVFVKNIGFSSGMAGTVYYNSTNDYWGIDTDLKLRIKPEALIIDPIQNT